MKGILKTGLLLLSAVFIGAGSVYAYELLPEERQLADYFANRCNTAPQILQWPVGFEHPVDKFACDITSYLKREFSTHNRYLFQLAQHAKKPDVSFINQKVSIDHFSESLWAKFISIPFDQTAVQQAALGNPQAFEFISRWPDRVQLTDAARKQLQSYYPEQILRVFEVPGHPSNAAIDDFVLWTAANIHQLSPQLLRAAQNRIYREITHERTMRADIAHYVLSKPYYVRAALLSIWTLATYDPRQDELLDFFQMINWTGPAFNSAQEVFNQPAAWSMNNLSHPYIYFSYMRQLEDLSQGIPIAIRPSIAVGNTLLIREFGWPLQFDRYFPKASEMLKKFQLTDDKKALKQDYRDLEAWLRGNDQSLQKFAIQELLVYSKGFREYLRTDSIFGDIPIEKLDSLQSMARTIADRQGTIFEHLFVERAFYFSDSFGPDKPKYFEDIILQKQDRIKDACDISQASDEYCFRNWVSFPGTHLPVVTGACVLNPRLEAGFLSKILRNGVIPTPVIIQCDGVTIEKAAEGKLKLPLDLALTHGFPMAAGGVRWAGSRDAVTGSGMPLLGIHWLNVANRNNFPITDNDNLVALWFGRDGLSFLRKHSQSAITDLNEYEVQGKAFGYFDSYRASQQFFGRYAEAFQTSLKKIDHEREFFPYRPWQEFAELYYSGANLGIPKDYLTEYIKKNSAYQLADYQAGADQIRLIEFYKGFLSNASADMIERNLTSVIDSPDRTYWVIGAVYGLDPMEKTLLCANPEFKNLAYSDKVNWNLLDAAGTFARFERGNLDSICRGQSLVERIQAAYRATPSSTKQIPEEFRTLGEEAYREILELSFNPFILNHQNIVHPRWLDSLFVFSAFAGLANREYGILFSLLALKSVYSELVTSFVNTDGVGLRSELHKLEAVLTELGFGIQRLAGKLDSETWKDLWELHTSLMLVVRNPLLNDRVRDRLMVFDTPNEAIKMQVKAQATELAAEFKKMRMNSARASTIMEFIQNRVSRRNPDEISFSPFKASDTFWRIIPAEWKARQISFVSLASNGASIQVLALGSDGQLVTGNSSFIQQELDIRGLKDEIKQTNTISESTRQRLCSALKGLHGLLSSSLDGAKAIHFVPSVNLLPLPPEIILGPGCREQVLPPLYLVNDLLASLELATSTRVTFPSNLVAAANPMIRQSGLIDFSKFRSPNLHRSGQPEFDLTSLAPLPDAEIEVTNIAPEFGKSTLLIGSQGNIREALKIVDQDKGTSMLVLATHGFAASESASEALPGLLSIKDGELDVVTSLDIYDYDLDDSIVLLSACSTASGFVERTDQMFTGFVKSIADAGAKVIVSSLWPVNSVASRRLTENFVSAWKRTGDIDEGLKVAKLMDRQELSWPFVFIYP